MKRIVVTLMALLLTAGTMKAEQAWKNESELITLAAHILNQDGQVQFTPAADLKGVG